MKKLSKKIVTLLLAVLFVLPFVVPLNVEAAAKKVTAGTKESKAVTVKTGEYIVKSKKSQASYWKFKAPSKGTYTITISQVRGTKNSKDMVNGFVTLNDKKNGYYSYHEKCKTEGGKNDIYNIASKSFVNALYENGYSDKLVNRYLTKRTIKVSLQKGQTIYGYSYCCASDKYVQYTLKIKK